MQVGDLVRLSSRQTRKGFDYEDKVGLIIKAECISISENDTEDLYTVSFGRVARLFVSGALRLISENKS